MLRHDQMPPIPETPRQLPDGPLYFVGVGGAGMSALAQILAERGRAVSGGDPGIAPAIQARLENAGVRVWASHDAAQLPEGVGAVVVSDAVPETNPEVVMARQKNVPIFRRPEVLGAIVNAGRGIAIAGTHGKTTTTGMVASILLAANLDPTIILGGDLPQIGGNARSGKSDIVLAESCEAYDGFLYLHPEIAVVLNIEADHLDYHLTEQHVFDSFTRFIGQAKRDVIFCHDDAKTNDVVIPWIRETQTRAVGNLSDTIRATDYGITSECFWTAENIHNERNGVAFDIFRPGSRQIDDDPFISRISLSVFGHHNVLNALAAFSVAVSLRIKMDNIIAGLKAFTGTGRRFEILGEKNGVLIIDDYAHHPTELRATLSAAKSAYPNRRIVAVFQPHLPSRTRDLMDEFADALTLADAVYLTDIYLARENPLPGISSEVLAEKVRAAKPDLTVELVPDLADLPAKLASDAQSGDLVLTLGAGDIRMAGEGLRNLL